MTKKPIAKIPPVKGTRDFYPDVMAQRNWITDAWRRISLRNGFVEYDGPIFEYLKLFTEKSGAAIAGELFSLTDRGGRELAIRPEMTPTLARMVNQQINSLPRPIKWFSIPRCCRAERPQRGRLREFFQWNIDIIGADSILADVESIFTAIDYLRSVGLTAEDIVVKISSREMLAALLTDIGFAENELDKLYALLDKRGKIPTEAFEEMAAEQIPDKTKRQDLINLLDKSESLDELTAHFGQGPVGDSLNSLSTLFHQLDIMGVREYCEFDINIVRGLAYYTGPVFEIFDRGNQLRAICGGGRYDNLLAGFGGPQISGTGFGMGDVVLGILLEEKGLLKPDKNSLDFFVIDDDGEQKDNVLSIVAQLRQADYSAGFSYKTLPAHKQLKLASAQNARCAVILDTETRDNNMVRIRNMATRTQEKLPLADFLQNPKQT